MTKIDKLTKTFLADINYLLAAYVREQTVLGWKLREEREHERKLWENMYVASTELSNHIFGENHPVVVSDENLKKLANDIAIVVRMLPTKQMLKKAKR